MEALRGRLLAWYDQSKRDLPWRALVRAGGAAAAGNPSLCTGGAMLAAVVLSRRGFPQLHENGGGWWGWDGAPGGAGNFVMGDL